MKYLKLFEEVNIKKEMDIPSDILDISKIFNDNGYDLFVVGGAVRDYVMGKEPKDYDLVTNAQPAAIQRILKDKYRLGLQGRHFAVIRVYTDETPEGIEIASYRKDISKGRDNKDSNDPKVEYGRHITIRDDVRRRDLTMNALYYDINKKKIVDLVGGLEDIKNKVIRAVGNPRERFREDRLRILRTFRFAAMSNSKIDKDTSIAIKNDNRLNGISEIDDVSQERVIGEFYSMLNWSIEHNDKKSWERYYNLLENYKMFDRMFPDLNLNIEYYDTLNDILIFSLLFINNEPGKELYYKLIINIKLSKDISKSIIFLLKLKYLFNDLNIDQVLDYDNKYDNIISIYKDKVDNDIDDDVIKEFSHFVNIPKKYINAFIKYIPTTDNKKLMEMGYKGKELGDKIKQIEIEKFKELL